MRPLPLAVLAGFLVFSVAAQAQTGEKTPPLEEAIADAETAELADQPIALVPVISEPLPAFATGAPVRLDPYKPAAAPNRPPPPSRPRDQARPY